MTVHFVSAHALQTICFEIVHINSKKISNATFPSQTVFGLKVSIANHFTLNEIPEKLLQKFSNVIFFVLILRICLAQEYFQDLNIFSY